MSGLDDLIKEKSPSNIWKTTLTTNVVVEAVLTEIYSKAFILHLRNVPFFNMKVKRSKGNISISKGWSRK